MRTLESISRRKSVRTYTPKIIEADVIKDIVEAGNMAAKAGSIQFHVITNPEVLNMISKSGKTVMLNSGNDFLVKAASNPNYSPIYNAPVMVIVSAETSSDEYQKSMYIANAACAAENMLLAATDKGLGSCYLVSATLAFAIPEVKAAAAIDSKLDPICSVVFGYSEDTTPHAPRNNNPDNIHYIK